MNKKIAEKEKYLCIFWINKVPYQTESHSVLHAKLRCYADAYCDGVWQPRILRQKWWQFWRPKEYSQFEQMVQTFVKATTVEEELDAIKS